MVPAAYAVIAEFPLTPSGKVDRRALAVATLAPSDSRANDSAARDSVELQLGSLWRDILGREDVGLFDNFFELGGDSFVGVRMVAGVRRDFGVDLTLADIFRAPTVAALAELVRSGGDQLSRGPLVQLQAGDGTSPLYVFHPLPGTVVRYANFARALGSDQTVWGVQSVGLQPGEDPHESIEAMADHYVDALRSVHPGGPWHLVGYSMGGVLAVEVARRLRANGDPIGLVGLLDTNLHVDIDQDTDYATRILVRFGLRLDVDIEELCRLDPEERTARLLELGTAAGTLPADYDADRLRRMLEMYRHNGTALAAHTVLPYDGPIVLFRARDRSMDEGHVDSTLGWHAVTGRLDIIDVPGDHFHMMEIGNVEQMARHVRARMNGGA